MLPTRKTCETPGCTQGDVSTEGCGEAYKTLEHLTDPEEVKWHMDAHMRMFHDVEHVPASPYDVKVMYTTTEGTPWKYETLSLPKK